MILFEFFIVRFIVSIYLVQSQFNHSMKIGFNPQLYSLLVLCYSLFENLMVRWESTTTTFEEVGV